MSKRFLLACIVAFPSAAYAGEQSTFRSHPPMRPLPVASTRPPAIGPSFFVDPADGRDDAEGSQLNPWKTLGHAVTKLKPGCTLYLRGGVYYERVALEVSGTAEAPITIRSFPGELAVIDGGLREFSETPDQAWEPCPDGAEGEFRSVKTYDLGSTANQTHLLGNFVDSMVPLQGYKYLSDLRSSNVYFNLPVNVGPEGSIYCGPGVCLDASTGRIHVRLAHTKMKYLPLTPSPSPPAGGEGEGVRGDNYTGETDPRKVPLVIAGDQETSPLSLHNAAHVRVLDLVVRGSRGPTVQVIGCEDVEFDGLTVFGGSSCFAVKDTVGLRILNTACRGIAAPWTFRGSLKYRSIEARIFSASGWQPTGRDNADFELAYSEFTDCVDGVFIGNIKGVRFHHNLVDNVSDDGIFLTAGTGYDGVTPGGDVHIFENRLSRCLTMFAFGVGHGRQKVIAGGQQTGSGVYIYRNVFDFRRPVMYHQPRSAEEPQEVTSKGRFASDHGSPAWEPMTIYHNTIIADDAPRYSYGTIGLGNGIGRGTRRRVFNNIVVQSEYLPGNVFPPTNVDFQADGNLLWSLKQGANIKADLFAKFHDSKAFAESKAKYAPGWGVSDRVADPKLVKVDANWQRPLDLRLQPTSPARDAGVPLPEDWPDPLRKLDKEKPDIGAVPLGVAAWNVGQNGRLTVFGDGKPLPRRPTLPPMQYTPRPPISEKATKVAIVEGYPAFDAPLLSYALRKQGANITSFERAWLAPEKYAGYDVVVLTGNLARAKVTPSKYSADDLKHIEAFLQNGGTLLLTISGREILQSLDGRKFLADITGVGTPAKATGHRVLMPGHPWVKHMRSAEPVWLTELAKRPGFAMNVREGQSILGGADGSSVLYRQNVGKGAFIYIGWQIHDSLPYTREKTPTVEQENMYEEQMHILMNLSGALVRH